MATKITEEEIIDFYKSNNIIPIRKEDLQRPSKEFVLQLYTRILEKLDVYNVNQPDILASVNGLNDHMEKTYLVINVFTIINRFVSSVGLNDIKMVDILEPKRGRTIRILHALANYYVRYNTLKVDWFEYAKKFSELHHERKELEKRKVELKHTIEEKTMLLSSLKNKSVGIEKELKSSEEIFTTKKREAEKEEKTAAEMKVEILELKEKLCEIKLESGEIVESNKKLSEKVIRSPDKIISAMNDSENKLKTLKNEFQLIKSQYNELQTKRNSYSISETFVVAIKELKELFELQSKNDEQCKELEEIIKNTSDLDEEMAQIEIKKKNLEESIQSLKTIINKENAEFMRKKSIH
ncbi:Nuf2 domain containing protein [Euroglyphus maynei]|uniref:Nuf2 domain containing protein n=1 Tax=Euroglyphus maynei TaxID=6958 RepID=A0A1Y3BGY8_EURMA|nr:Nuf2 domain containing protein [Euroglyphus maynei]